MDESLQELEAELKSLRPRRPSAQLRGRLARELDRPHYSSATNLASWKWFGWRTAGLAAAAALVAVVSLVNFERPQPPAATTRPLAAADLPAAAPTAPETTPPRDRYQPVAATNVLYDLQDEGPVRVEGDTPARRLRYRYLDTYTWKNPRNNASLKWSVPRDEIRVLPASLN